MQQTIIEVGTALIILAFPVAMVLSAASFIMGRKKSRLKAKKTFNKTLKR